MSINQLHDDGAVIGYQPTLQYTKERINNGDESAKQSLETNHSGKITYSNTIIGLKNNLPSTSLKNIDFVLKNMKLLIDKLAATFQNGNWNQYGEISSLLSAIESNNTEYIDSFIAYHQQSITGSLVPELIGTIYDTEKRLRVLSTVIKELYYGTASISTEDAKQKDEDYLKKIQAFEADGNMAQIGYLAISSDISVNRSVNMYAFQANEQVIGLANVVNKTDDTTTDESKASLLVQYFEDANNEIKYRKDAYDTQQSIEIMQKTLYNYYNKRKEMLALYDIFGANSNSVFIGNRIQACRKQLDEALENINRSFVGNQYFLSEMAKLESEKYFLKNLYASFSYKSDV